MRITNRFAHQMFAGAIALAMITLATRASAENIEQVITVIKVNGGARYSMDGGKTFSMLNKGDVLRPGTQIQTADKGTVDLALGEPITVPVTSISSPSSPISTGGGDVGPKANIVRIFPNSMLSVDKLTLEKTGMDEVAETQLDLKAGKIMGNVKKLSAASRYEVKIPNGVAGIRGTTYLISADGTLYVLSGSVVLSYVDGGGQLRTVTVLGGQSFNPANPGNPVPIPSGLLGDLRAIYRDLGFPRQVSPISYDPNGTVIHLSPN